MIHTLSPIGRKCSLGVINSFLSSKVYVSTERHPLLLGRQRECGDEVTSDSSSKSEPWGYEPCGYLGHSLVTQSKATSAKNPTSLKDLPAFAPISSDDPKNLYEFLAHLLTRTTFCFPRGKHRPTGLVVGILTPQTARGIVFRLAESQSTQDNGWEGNLLSGVHYRTGLEQHLSQTGMHFGC